MQLASPEGFKQSEEAVSHGAPVTSELPFVNILNHLLKADVAVPMLHYYDEAAGLLYLEDLGDVTLALASQEGASPDTPGLYREAVDAYAKAAVRAPRDSGPPYFSFKEAGVL